MRQRNLYLLLIILYLPNYNFAQTDTVPVFHHNYLVERQADLRIFADELVAYAITHGCAEELQEKALQFQEEVAAVRVWESEKVDATINKLALLLGRGTSLREELIIDAEGPSLQRTARRYFRLAFPYVLAVLAFPLVFYLVFRRR